MEGPLDPPALEALALRYVERYQTTRARLTRYLARKLRECGWAGESPPEPAAVAERLAALGLVDDWVFAQARARGLARRGYGPRRILGALAEAGIGGEDGAQAIADIDGWAAAIRYARRHRLGPFGAPDAALPLDRAARERQIGRMVRAGHAPSLARRIVSASAEAELADGADA